MVRWFGSGATEQVVMLDISDVKPNPYQPRKTFASGKIEELSESIREMGIIQPLIVRKIGSSYELIAGERRLRAAQSVGITHVPALVKQYTDQEVAQATLIENIQREDLNVIEEAAAYDQLLTDFNLTQEELARRIGKSQSTIANKRRLLKLADEVKEMIGSGLLNERQARAMLKVQSFEEQILVAERIVEDDLNVKQTEELVERVLAGEKLEEAGVAVSRPVRKVYIRDVRIFLNTVRDAVGIMKKSGFDTQVVEKDDEDYYEFVVRIAKRGK